MKNSKGKKIKLININHFVSPLAWISKKSKTVSRTAMVWESAISDCLKSHILRKMEAAQKLSSRIIFFVSRAPVEVR